MVDTILNIKVDKMMKMEGDGKIKAFCDLIFGDLFLVRGFKVIEGERGLFVGVPQRENRQGKRFNIFVPATEEIRAYIEEVILQAYQEEGA